MSTSAIVALLPGMPLMPVDLRIRKHIPWLSCQWYGRVLFFGSEAQAERWLVERGFEARFTGDLVRSLPIPDTDDE